MKLFCSNNRTPNARRGGSNFLLFGHFRLCLTVFQRQDSYQYIHETLITANDYYSYISYL